MSEIEIDALAKAMYEERGAERGPAWVDLGEVTRSVWLEKAQAEMYGDLA